MDSTGFIWIVIFIIVAAIIFALIWYFSKLDTSKLGPITREEYNKLLYRVNFMWALLIFWIILNLVLFGFAIFGAAAAKSAGISVPDAAKYAGIKFEPL